MTNVTLPREDIAITSRGDRVSTDWFRWARDITQRVGGVRGSSSDDLTLSQFEDAGIAEGHAALFALQDAIGQAPVRDEYIRADDPSGELSALREEVALLRARLDALEQGN